MADVLDLSAPDRSPMAVHVVGVGGAGMSGIATVLAGMGHRVSGSDLKDSSVLRRLRLQGVDVHVGHDAGHLPAAVDCLVVSTAIPDHNPEVRAAREAGVPVLRRAEALRAVTRTRRTVAVSGTHGKTTTSSMLALVLRSAGWSPSFLIGGEVNEVGANAVHDEGDWLVVEADESDGTFVELEAEAVVVTNVEPDHLEHYGGFEGLVDAFREFLAAPGPVVACADDRTSAALAAEVEGAVTYGFAEGADHRLAGYEPRASGSHFVLRAPDGRAVEVDLPVPGRHNALNAAGAAAVALELGVEPDAVRSALGRFAGVSRRLEFRGRVDGVTVVDDYAHLPSEVRAAISAAREGGGWERVIAVFQPHRYSRTATLWRDFAHAFDEADVVVLTDVYAAGEPPRPGVSGELILRSVLEAGGAGRVLYLPRRADVEAHLPALARSGDLVLTLGAGDITAATDGWLARAEEPA